MHFETLIAKVYRQRAELEFELARCHDVYRLAHLLKVHTKKMEILLADATEMVQELERGR